jgi:phosphatidylglycerol:prolipoprotein diacylglycerol transferase
MLPIIQIGPAVIQSFVLALLVALWLGAFFTERECNRHHLDGNAAWNVVALGVAATLLSARLVFVLQNWNVYANDLAQIVSLTPNALSLDYGVLLGIVAVYAYLRWRKMPLARFADALAPGALIAIAIIAFGQFLSGEAYGTPTDLPWAVSFWGERLHPVQLYDALAALIGWGIVTRIHPRFDGQRALIALAWYSAARLFIDAFRAEVLLLGDGYRVNQIVAWIVLLLALGLLRANEGRGTNA